MASNEEFNCALAQRRSVELLSQFSRVGLRELDQKQPDAWVIELEPEDPELVEVGDMGYLPGLVAIDCPRCSAEVRLDRFLEDFTLREL